MRWRSETVITFQTTTNRPEITKAGPMMNALAVKAGTAKETAVANTLKKSSGTRPNRRSSGAAANDPTRLPAAKVVMRMPNSGSDRFIGPGARRRGRRPPASPPRRGSSPRP
jgi:hypothetical protein